VSQTQLAFEEALFLHLSSLIFTYLVQMQSKRFTLFLVRPITCFSITTMRSLFLMIQLTSVVMLTILMSSGAGAQTLIVKAYTEDWPPYNFVKNKEVTGISAEVLRAACELAELKCESQLVPWVRAYKTVQDTPNTLVYTIARIPSRESQFIWIGPIATRTTWIYARSAIADKIQKFADLNQFRVGMIRDEASMTELTDAGVSKSAIKVFNSQSDEMRLFKSGHIDAVINTEIGMAMSQKQYDISATEVTKLMKLYDGGGLYFGMNLQSDPKLAEKLQIAVDKLRRDGRIQAIVQQYVKLP
jgi:polar amino acid transport system substrate-binding protein